MEALNIVPKWLWKVGIVLVLLFSAPGWLPFVVGTVNADLLLIINELRPMFLTVAIATGLIGVSLHVSHWHKSHAIQYIEHSLVILFAGALIPVIYPWFASSLPQWFSVVGGYLGRIG